MRHTLFLLAALTLGSEVTAAANPGPFHPLPLGQVQWDGDTPGMPTTGGLAGRWQVIAVVDCEEGEGKTGRGTMSNFIGNFAKNQTSEQRFIPILIGVNGNLARRDEGVENVILKGSVSPGLLTSLAGDGSGALILVAPSGRVTRLQRHSGDTNEVRTKLEKDLPAATPLVPVPAAVPLSCKAALQLLRVGDVAGALNLARKKLGPDGAALIKSMSEQANALVEADTAVFAALTSAASDRFIARERLKGLLVEFPGLPAGAAARDALKVKPDKDLLAEQAAWARLQDYFMQMAKLSPKKAAAFQQQSIPAIIAGCPGTYAAELAGMIKAAARLP